MQKNEDTIRRIKTTADFPILWIKVKNRLYTWGKKTWRTLLHDCLKFSDSERFWEWEIRRGWTHLRGFSDDSISRPDPPRVTEREKVERKIDKKNRTGLGREPWSSGWGRRLRIRRLFVWILVQNTGWTFFTLNCCKIVWCLTEKTENRHKEAEVGPFKKRTDQWKKKVTEAENEKTEVQAGRKNQIIDQWHIKGRYRLTKRTDKWWTKETFD